MSLAIDRLKKITLPAAKQSPKDSAGHKANTVAKANDACTGCATTLPAPKHAPKDSVGDKAPTVAEGLMKMVFGRRVEVDAKPSAKPSAADKAAEQEREAKLRRARLDSVDAHRASKGKAAVSEGVDEFYRLSGFSGTPLTEASEPTVIGDVLKGLPSRTTGKDDAAYAKYHKQMGSMYSGSREWNIIGQNGFKGGGKFTGTYQDAVKHGRKINGNAKSFHGEIHPLPKS